MKTNRIFCIFSLLVIVMAFAKIVVGLHFWVIPPVFFAVGLAVALWNREYALYLFLFLFPFISISPGLMDSRYPFNYIAVPLFLLSGIVVAMVIRKLRGDEDTGDNIADIDGDFMPYHLFLMFLVISTVFVLLRWTNITLGSEGAMGVDTPAAPPAPDITSPDQLKWSEQRVSFASIFPVVSLFIYFISPYSFFYTRKVAPGQEDVFKWVSFGFWVSVGIAVVQKIANRSLLSDRLGKELKQFYGGSSDFNSFGFFAGVMLLWATYEIKKKNVVGYISFIVALAGGILSGSRTFYFFILAGVANLLFWALGSGVKRMRSQKVVVIGVIVVVVLAVIFAGGTLAKRFGEGFSGDQDLVEKLNTITNGRVWMGLFTFETIRDNFFPGVGTGNFTFYLSYKNYLPLKLEGKKYLYDLTLNQYLLVFAENGVIAFVFFTFFMVFLFRRSSKKLLLGTILFSLLLNNFFWFPEAFLLFWIVAALNHGEGDGEKKKFPYTKILIGVSLLIFIVFNIVSFDRLHPESWAAETGVHYDYGFWYPEKSEAGEEYRWTKGRSGIYIQLDKNGESPEIKLVCGAPLAHLEGKTQTVEIYWKGNFCREVAFTENNEVYYRVKSHPLEGGFLEFRISPVFNLKELGLGAEPRDLGLQFFIL